MVVGSERAIPSICGSQGKLPGGGVSIHQYLNILKSLTSKEVIKGVSSRGNIVGKGMGHEIYSIIECAGY